MPVRGSDPDDEVVESADGVAVAGVVAGVVLEPSAPEVEPELGGVLLELCEPPPDDPGDWDPRGRGRGLHHDGPVHERVNRAEVGEGSGLGERVRAALALLAAPRC